MSFKPISLCSGIIWKQPHGNYNMFDLWNANVAQSILQSGWNFWSWWCLDRVGKEHFNYTNLFSFFLQQHNIWFVWNSIPNIALLSCPFWGLWVLMFPKQAWNTSQTFLFNSKLLYIISTTSITFWTCSRYCISIDWVRNGIDFFHKYAYIAKLSFQHLFYL